MFRSGKKSTWQILSLSGAVGVVFYAMHVIIGGILWKGYSHISQTISELTGSGAPNAGLLRIFTGVYGVLLVIFSFCMYFLFKQWKANKAAYYGALMLIIMELSSFIGYSLFPLDENSIMMMSFQNIMHIVVTALVVFCTLGASYLIGIGLKKSISAKGLGLFVLICSIVITISGAATPVVMANNIEISGLIERINIFTLQTWIFVLSVYMFKNKIIFSSEDESLG